MKTESKIKDQTVRISYFDYKRNAENGSPIAYEDVPKSYDPDTKTIEIYSDINHLIQGYFNKNPSAEDLMKIYWSLYSGEFTLDDCRTATKAQAASTNSRLVNLAQQLQTCLDKYDELNK